MAYLRLVATLVLLVFAEPALAQAPTTTTSNINDLLSPCLANVPVVGNGAGVSPKCHASGALGSAAFVAIGTSGATIGLLNAANTWSATQAFAAMTATTFNGLTITTSTGTLTITNGKTATFSNTLTLAGTDGSTLNVGGGGTLGNNAFTSTAYAPLASPTFTGTPAAPTAAVDTNTTQIATTAMVLGQAASATPLADNVTAAVGTSTRYARADHVHPIPNLAPITNSLGSPVSITLAGTYVDGPSVAQGSTGTWFASGNATVGNASGAPAGSDVIGCKLWDGTTIIDSGTAQLGNNLAITISLSGYLASPAGNLRISCTDFQHTAAINVTNGVDAKASTISAFRIN